jgi:invasion protein IalB
MCGAWIMPPDSTAERPVLLQADKPYPFGQGNCSPKGSDASNRAGGTGLSAPHQRRSCPLNTAPAGTRAIDKAGLLKDTSTRVPQRGPVPTGDWDVKRHFLRTFGAIAALLATMALPATGVLAQGVVKAQYGDWQMSCDTPPGASFEQCAIIQNVTAEDQPNVGLSVIVLKTADGEARLLRVLAPLGVLLPNGLGLNVDGNNMGRVAFVRCLPNGCVAEVVMDDDLLKILSEGQDAVFVVFKTPEEGIGIPVSLNGFRDGFDNLP